VQSLEFQLLLQLVNGLFHFVVQFTPRLEIGELIYIKKTLLTIFFRMKTQTAEICVFIKHNLLLEFSSIFRDTEEEMIDSNLLDLIPNKIFIIVGLNATTSKADDQDMMSDFDGESDVDVVEIDNSDVEPENEEQYLEEGLSNMSCLDD
jgi:hypothetical protein